MSEAEKLAILCTDRPSGVCRFMRQCEEVCQIDTRRATDCGDYSDLAVESITDDPMEYIRNMHQIEARLRAENEVLKRQVSAAQDFNNRLYNTRERDGDRLVVAATQYDWREFDKALNPICGKEMSVFCSLPRHHDGDCHA